MFIRFIRTESALGASERGSADELTADELRACHETARNAGAVRLASSLSSTSSVHQFNRKQGLEAGKGDLRLMNPDEPDEPCRGARSRPGRQRPAYPAPDPTAPRASDNLYESGMNGAACARHSAVSADTGTTSREHRPCRHASRDLFGRRGHSSPGEESPSRLLDQTSSDVRFILSDVRLGFRGMSAWVFVECPLQPCQTSQPLQPSPPLQPPNPTGCVGGTNGPPPVTIGCPLHSVHRYRTWRGWGQKVGTHNQYHPCTRLSGRGCLESDLFVF